MSSFFSSLFMDAQGHPLWTPIAGMTFAIVFLIVGIMRVVEFSGLNLSKFQKCIFIPAHIIGCFLFSSVAALITVDTHGIYRSLMNSFFAAGIVILFPIHIFIGIKRRIKIKQLNGIA